MNRDLEETLSELGPEYRAVVARLRAGSEAESATRTSRTAGWLVAAASLLVVGLAVIFIQSNNRTIEQSSASPAPHEYVMSVDEMIATQNPDGSWANEFLTRRNAAALKGRSDFAAQVAYKKAVRNLRAHGVL